jgi:hypothetical protein
VAESKTLQQIVMKKGFQNSKWVSVTMMPRGVFSPVYSLVLGVLQEMCLDNTCMHIGSNQLHDETCPLQSDQARAPAAAADIADARVTQFRAIRERSHR